MLDALGVYGPRNIKQRIVASVDPVDALRGVVESGGRLDVAKAIAYLDDVLVVKGAGAEPDTMVRGRIDRPQEWNLCGEQHDLGDVRKIVPSFAPGESKPMRVIFRQDGGIDEARDCEAWDTEIRFSPLDDGDPKKYQASRPYQLSELRDVVPAMFRPPEATPEDVAPDAADGAGAPAGGGEPSPTQ